MERIVRSFELVAHSYRILMQDRELMLLPLWSGVVTLAVVALVSVGFSVWHIAPQTMGAAAYGPAFGLYVLLYATGIFFQAAVVAGATERMRGGNPTLGSALGAAASRFGTILLWAFVAATVGVLLRAVQERVGILGKLVTGLVGAAWSLATLFVVPVIVLEDRPLGDSIWRSSDVFKQTWGETMAGSVGLGIAAFCAWLLLVVATAALASLVGIWSMALFAVGAIGLTVFFSALQGVYLASLFRYAADGPGATGLDRHLLAQAFERRRD